MINLLDLIKKNGTYSKHVKCTQDFQNDTTSFISKDTCYYINSINLISKQYSYVILKSKNIKHFVELEEFINYFEFIEKEIYMNYLSPKYTFVNENNYQVFNEPISRSKGFKYTSVLFNQKIQDVTYKYNLKWNNYTGHSIYKMIVSQDGIICNIAEHNLLTALLNNDIEKEYHKEFIVIKNIKLKLQKYSGGYSNMIHAVRIVK